jgi:hypothetical protein
VYPQINSTQVFKITSTFYTGFAREGVTGLFLIKNVYAGNLLPTSYGFSGPGIICTVDVLRKQPDYQ